MDAKEKEFATGYLECCKKDSCHLIEELIQCEDFDKSKEGKR